MNLLDEGTSVSPDTLEDLPLGGGPGGGGGRGIPGAHCCCLKVLSGERSLEEAPLVLIAPVDIARREAGGRVSASRVDGLAALTAGFSTKCEREGEVWRGWLVGTSNSSCPP